MLAVIRYSVPGPQSEEFAGQAREILDTFAAQPGFLTGQLSRSVDEEELWVLVTEWEGAGFYRRALSAARLVMYPLMTLMINEPSAFEPCYRSERDGASPKLG
ncbi:Antibiotic biosynthesis monooxygenase [Sinosporangium album]|uniref:Antibiotic biosynthesis monooxygenase n=1 Tax=Sinosporangium album TaxID=504805 RepID=A0A1G7SAY7_9ACTN|nr:antibiotic biosynthesis monooxygenase family protein [Sinosporangium album]SDG19619.1 Antibiotic biosynthesis monooxygenase [Sinosporangium album]